MSDEGKLELKQYLKTSAPVRINDFIGKEVLCEDGFKRKVETILAAADFRFVYINTTDKFEGHKCHLLKLTKGLRGFAPPSQGEIEEFDKIAKSFSIEWQNKEEKGEFKWRPEPNRKERRKNQAKARHLKLVPKSPR